MADNGKAIWVKAVGLPPEGFAWHGLTPATHRQIVNGEIFQCWEKNFSPKWMVKHDGPPPAPPQERPAGPARAGDLAREIERLQAENAALKAEKEPLVVPNEPEEKPRRRGRPPASAVAAAEQQQEG